MKRRDLIKLVGGAATAAALTPFPAHAQQSTPTIGFLSARSREECAHLVEAFRRGLIEQGVVEGQHIAIRYRFADGHYDRLPAQAAELVHQPVSVLVAVGGDMTARAAIAATRTIPIVSVFIGDPVANGLVPASTDRAATSPESAISTRLSSPSVSVFSRSSFHKLGRWLHCKFRIVPRLVVSKRILKPQRKPWDWGFGSGKPIPKANLRRRLKQ